MSVNPNKKSIHNSENKNTWIEVPRENGHFLGLVAFKTDEIYFSCPI